MIEYFAFLDESNIVISKGYSTCGTPAGAEKVTQERYSDIVEGSELPVGV